MPRLQDPNPEQDIHIHRIPAHVGVSGNEAADIAAKEATGWRDRGSGPQAPLANNLKLLTSAMRPEIRTKAKEAWDKAWTKEPYGKTTRKLTRKPTKDVLKKVKQMTRSKSTVIVQARTGKIGLRDLPASNRSGTFTQMPLRI